MIYLGLLRGGWKPEVFLVLEVPNILKQQKLMKTNVYFKYTIYQYISFYMKNLTCRYCQICKFEILSMLSFRHSTLMHAHPYTQHFTGEMIHAVWHIITIKDLNVGSFLDIYLVPLSSLLKDPKIGLLTHLIITTD